MKGVRAEPGQEYLCFCGFSPWSCCKGSLRLGPKGTMFLPFLCPQEPSSIHSAGVDWVTEYRQQARCGGKTAGWQGGSNQKSIWIINAKWHFSWLLLSCSLALRGRGSQTLFGSTWKTKGPGPDWSGWFEGILHPWLWNRSQQVCLRAKFCRPGLVAAGGHHLGNC